MKNQWFIVPFLLLVISCSIPKEEPLKNVSYNSTFPFKDSLKLNFIHQEALNDLIVDYKCTAILDQDTLRIEYGSFGGFESLDLTFKIHKDSMKVNVLRKTCMGGIAYKTIYCKAVIDEPNLKIGDRVSIYIDAQFLNPRLDSIPEDSTGLIILKGCLWNLRIWDKDVTDEQKREEYFENKRREFFVKARNPLAFKSLDLRGQFPNSIPKEIVNFQNLKSLKLGGNKLQAKDFEWIVVLKSLEELDIGHNELKEFPLPILELLNLKKLELFQNEISELPKDLSRLTKLEELYLGRNKFKAFPDRVLTLKQLEKIELSQNEIAELPKDILKLRQLEVLYLEGNKFQTFPPILKQMKHLKDLSLYNNPFPE
jgi:hypothetical protein